MHVDGDLRPGNLRIRSELVGRPSAPFRRTSLSSSIRSNLNTLIRVEPVKPIYYRYYASSFPNKPVSTVILQLTRVNRRVPLSAPAQTRAQIMVAIIFCIICIIHMYKIYIDIYVCIHTCLQRYITRDTCLNTISFLDVLFNKLMTDTHRTTLGVYYNITGRGRGGYYVLFGQWAKYKTDTIFTIGIIHMVRICFWSYVLFSTWFQTPINIDGN